MLHSLQIPSFESRTVFVGFVVDRVVQSQVFSVYLCLRFRVSTKELHILSPLSQGPTVTLQSQSLYGKLLSLSLTVLIKRAKPLPVLFSSFIREVLVSPFGIFSEKSDGVKVTLLNPSTYTHSYTITYKHTAIDRF